MHHEVKTTFHLINTTGAEHSN